jgi:two-component system, sensor histidine kinase LadS
MIPRTLFSLLAALLMLLCAPSHARTVLDLDTRAQPVALQDWGDYWVDTTGQLTAQQVAALPDLPWRPTAPDDVYPVTSGQAAWIRIQIPPAPDSERWYLQIPDPAVTRASLFTLDSNGKWNEQSAGRQIAVNRWPVPHRYPLLPIALSAEVPTQYLLRIENNHPHGTPLSFISESHLSHREQRVSLLLGGFFGLAGLAGLVSMIIALSLRDSAFGWYAATVLLLSLMQAATTGLGGLHLWSQSAAINSLAGWVLPLVTAAINMLFVSAVTSMSERSSRLQRAMTGAAAVGLTAAIAIIFTPAQFRPLILVPVAMLLPALGVAALLWAWRRGDRIAPWVALSYLPLLLAAGWSLGPVCGLMPTGFFTLHGVQLAVAAHLPVVMVALMLRSQDRRENSRRIQGMDRVDPATGLINGHVFAERLTRMMARSTRLRHQSAVMLIDLINFDQIHRDFGRKAAEELPLRVAERLLSTAREIDSAARLADRRFGMLVEGPFGPEEAAAMGPRIVARCLMPFPGLHVECVAQVRIAYALVPHQDIDAAGLISLLEVRLATAPTYSKRAVYMLSTAPVRAEKPVRAITEITKPAEL